MSDIWDAIEEGDLARVTQLVRDAPHCVAEAYPDVGDQPLHAAVSQNQPQIVRLLLKNGADIDARGHLGRTPLSQAVHAQNTDMITLLLQHEADATIVDDSGFSPLYFAAMTEDQHTAETLLSLGAPLDLSSALYLKGEEYVLARLDDLADTAAAALLSDAVRTGSVALIGKLLEGGCDANARGRSKAPLLIEAVSNRQWKSALALLEHGADPHVRDYSAKSVVDVALFQRCPEDFVRTLREQYHCD